MNSQLFLIGILFAGFLVYWLIRDRIFNNSSVIEKFEHPASAGYEIRPAPLYPPRNVAPSGPNPPNQTANSAEVVVYDDPTPKDPYYESEESSAIPENLRYPERSFRPPPMNDNTQIAVDAGIASHQLQVAADNNQSFSTDFLQNGGEFMNGIFANDTTNDTSFSAF